MKSYELILIICFYLFMQAGLAVLESQLDTELRALERQKLELEIRILNQSPKTSPLKPE